MQLLYASIFHAKGKTQQPVLLASANDLSSFSYFTRSTVQEFLERGCQGLVRNTDFGERLAVGLEKNNSNYKAFVQVQNNELSAVVVAEEKYPKEVAFFLLKNILSEYESKSGETWEKIMIDQNEPCPFLQKLLSEYKNPNEVYKIFKIQEGLDDIKEIMYKNIEQVMRRGENLEHLQQKAETLSDHSGEFFLKAKKQNECCK